MEFRNAAFNLGKINDVDGSKVAVFNGDAIYTSIVTKLWAAGCVSMDVLTTKNYYAISLSAALFFGFGTRSFYKKRALHHKKGPKKRSLSDIISLASLRFL
ncbi:hypothetical protein [Peribacillus simplex]|uniref:hypothetical protein n=1 Tax=Peribacillus simplex TaxID=1478 RepID=UPI00333DE34D